MCGGNDDGRHMLVGEQDKCRCAVYHTRCRRVSYFPNVVTGVFIEVWQMCNENSCDVYVAHRIRRGVLGHVRQTFDCDNYYADSQDGYRCVHGGLAVVLLKLCCSVCPKSKGSRCNGVVEVYCSFEMLTGMLINIQQVYGGGEAGKGVIDQRRKGV